MHIAQRMKTFLKIEKDAKNSRKTVVLKLLSTANLNAEVNGQPLQNLLSYIFNKGHTSQNRANSRTYLTKTHTKI